MHKKIDTITNFTCDAFKEKAAELFEWPVDANVFDKFILCAIASVYANVMYSLAKRDPNIDIFKTLENSFASINKKIRENLELDRVNDAQEKKH